MKIRLCLAIALACLPLSALAHNGVSGSHEVISSAGAGMPCMTSRDQLHAMLSAARIKDAEGYQGAIVGSTVLEPGEHVLVLKNDPFMLLDTEIRILDGDDSGTV